MYMQYSPFLLSFNGKRLLPTRYVTWLITTPLMLYLYSLVSSVSTGEVSLPMMISFHIKHAARIHAFVCIRNGAVVQSSTENLASLRSRVVPFAIMTQKKKVHIHTYTVPDMC